MFRCINSTQRLHLGGVYFFKIFLTYTASRYIIEVMIKNKYKNGFTIIEVVLVLAIAGLIF